MSTLHNTPARLAGLEIDMANRAKRRDREARKFTGFSKAGKTANELRLIYRDGGGLDDDRQGRAMFSILLHTIANTGGDVAAKMTEARREFAPWLSPRTRNSCSAIGRPRRIRSSFAKPLSTTLPPS